ncbi:hypothetical protein SUBVAR_05272 [Subdoligranulum variabile DSM 15176]|uniref:Uncharacterized protein n=1 Tax=Subdoligranulum variabile DSM 15176 TaxID=411471 RepID=D1PLQ5_9FIRM|nr:hypothetical protein SUBVAR_05272 [Subdoligranulum variabile DSM 15176]
MPVSYSNSNRIPCFAEKYKQKMPRADAQAASARGMLAWE